MKADENPVIANIKTRRSVREYLDTPLSEETIKKVIDAGRYAPTGLNLQPWRFVVVQNKEMLKKLSDYAKPILVKNLEGRNYAGALNLAYIRQGRLIYYGEAYVAFSSPSPLFMSRHRSC
jgi:nitroreductase